MGKFRLNIARYCDICGKKSGRLGYYNKKKMCIECYEKYYEKGKTQ